MTDLTTRSSVRCAQSVSIRTLAKKKGKKKKHSRRKEGASRSNKHCALCRNGRQALIDEEKNRSRHVSSQKRVCNVSSALWAHVAGKGPQLLSGWDGNLWQRILFFARFEVHKQGDLAVDKHEVFNSSCGFTSAFHKTVNLDGCRKKDLQRRACIEDECEQRTLDFLLSFDISSEVFREFLVTIKISQGSHKSTDVLPRGLWSMICVS